MTSGYRQTYDRWRADPQAFWAEAAREIAWTKPPERIFDARRAASMAAGSPTRAATPASTRSTGMSRPAAATRSRSITTARSPATKRAITYRELLDETATLGAVLNDLGVAAGDRVLIYMPMIPEAIVAMLACARIGAVHSVVFGGFAAKELATRIDDAEPKVVLTASCGVEPGRIVEYKPLLDLAISLARHKPATCVVYQRPQVEGRHERAPRPRLDRACRRRQSGGQAGALRRPRRDRSALHSLHFRHDRNAEGRGARHRRLSGRAQMVDVGDLRRQARRDLLDRLRHRLGRRPFLHRLRAAAAGLRQRPLRGQTDRDAGRRRLLAGDRGLQGRRVLHRADRLARRAQGGPAGEAHQELRHHVAAHACSSPASAPTRTRSPGPRRFWASRWSITGGRPRPAGRSPPIRSAWGCSRSSSARRACRCRATTFTSSTRRRSPCRPGRWVRSSSSCRCRPAACRRSTARTSGCARATSTSSPAITKPPTPASSTRTAISPSSGGPTTSSTSPAIACRPAAWRRWSPRTRTSPNAPCLASRTRSKARPRAGLWS